mgnify:CR=1 FL=1
MAHGFPGGSRAFCPRQLDLAGVRIRRGDYDPGQLEAAVNQPRLTGDAVSHYRKLAAGTRALFWERIHAFGEWCRVVKAAG